MERKKQELKRERRGSTGEIGLFGKREREGGEEEEIRKESIFQRSKKIARSPVKGQKEGGEIEVGGLDEIKNELIKGLKEIGEEIKKKIEEELERKVGEELMGKIDSMKEELRQEM